MQMHGITEKYSGKQSDKEIKASLHGMYLPLFSNVHLPTFLFVVVPLPSAIPETRRWSSGLVLEYKHISLTPVSSANSDSQHAGVLQRNSIFPTHALSHSDALKGLKNCAIYGYVHLYTDVHTTTFSRQQPRTLFIFNLQVLLLSP